MDKIRFLHIPKTAGSTFTRILRGQYKGKQQFAFTGNIREDKKRFSELSRDEQKAIALFMGHAPILTGVKEADEIPIITILREPVSRVKSFCQYVSEGKVPHLLDSFPPEKFSLDEFLSSDNRELPNLQSRMLVNYEQRGSNLLVKALSPEEIKEKALDNLFNKVKCYGLQEYFDESLIRFSSLFGWKTPYYEYSNRKNQRRLLRFEEEHINRIRELNSIDIAFYEVARERFKSLVESDKHYKKKYEAYKRTQKLVAPMLKLYGSSGRYVKRKYRSLTRGQ